MEQTDSKAESLRLFAMRSHSGANLAELPLYVSAARAFLPARQLVRGLAVFLFGSQRNKHFYNGRPFRLCKQKIVVSSNEPSGWRPTGLSGNSLWACGTT